MVDGQRAHCWRHQLLIPDGEAVAWLTGNDCVDALDVTDGGQLGSVELQVLQILRLLITRLPADSTLKPVLVQSEDRILAPDGNSRFDRESRAHEAVVAASAISALSPH